MSIYDKAYQIFTTSKDPEIAFKILVDKLKNYLAKLADEDQTCRHCGMIDKAWNNNNQLDIEIYRAERWFCKSCNGGNGYDKTKRTKTLRD